MDKLTEFIEKNSIELVIWDFDGVIAFLDWNYKTTPEELLVDIYDRITAIDDSIVKDRSEFLTRLFPYPEINEVGIKHGREKQLKVKEVFEVKEASSIHRAKLNGEVVRFIDSLDIPQAIWSNNISKTIESVLETANIDDKISMVSSLDKVIRSKPDGEGFELIKNKFPEIKNNKIVFVGDSLISDKVAGKEVGINFWHYS